MTTEVLSEHERILVKLDALLGYFEHARKVAGELDRLGERMKSLETAVDDIYGQIFNHLVSKSEEPDAPPESEAPEEQSAEDFEAGVTEKFQERIKANTTRMEITPDDPKPKLSDLERRRKQERVSAIQKRVKEYGGELAGLLRELRT